MGFQRLVVILVFAAAVAWPTRGVQAVDQGQPQGPAAASADSPVFAVEITTGPKWDTSKPADQQPHFREHSANLRQLREQGVLVLGARYSEKGFLILAAPSVEAARAMLDRDPSIAAGVFSYEVHEMSVFYPGTVPARSRR